VRVRGWENEGREGCVRGEEEKKKCMCGRERCVYTLHCQRADREKKKSEKSEKRECVVVVEEWVRGRTRWDPSGQESVSLKIGSVLLISRLVCSCHRNPCHHLHHPSVDTLTVDTDCSQRGFDGSKGNF